jgi:hypothetical protein
VEYVVLAFFCGLSAGVVAKIKGGPFWIWFLVGLVLPLIGTIAAVLSRWDDSEPRRRCPECGTIVPLHDQVCMRCGRDLEFPADPAEIGPPRRPA